MQRLLEQLQGSFGDHYVIERELGRGGMATVYLAEDVKHARQVALKVLRPDLGAQVGTVRFLQEIRFAARLAHPHILPVYDSGEWEDVERAVKLMLRPARRVAA